MAATKVRVRSPGMAAYDTATKNDGTLLKAKSSSFR